VFTGIVQEVGSVASAELGRLSIAAAKLVPHMELGGSVAVNGACLTVTGLDAGSFTVEVIPETRRQTNLGLLRSGDRVNLELPLTLSGPLDGHLVQGHVDGTATVASVVRGGEEMTIRLETSSELMRYIVVKGFITVDGISLTVVDREVTAFLVSIIGYTRENTTLGERRAGDLVNLEVDIIAKYVEQLSQARSTGITVDFLQQHGFLAG
jgi:riboflavin synthase